MYNPHLLMIRIGNARVCEGRKYDRIVNLAFENKLSYTAIG